MHRYRQGGLFPVFSEACGYFVGVVLSAPPSLGPMGGAIAGGEDPETYRPPTIAPESTDGFGAGEEIKAEYVLVSVAADLVQATLDAIPDAVVIYPATTGSAVIAVPRDQQDLVQSSTGAIEDNQPVGTFTTDVERPTPPGLDRPAPR